MVSKSWTAGDLVLSPCALEVDAVAVADCPSVTAVAPLLLRFLFPSPVTLAASGLWLSPSSSSLPVPVPVPAAVAAAAVATEGAAPLLGMVIFMLLQCDVDEGETRVAIGQQVWDVYNEPIYNALYCLEMHS